MRGVWDAWGVLPWFRGVLAASAGGYWGVIVGISGVLGGMLVISAEGGGLAGFFECPTVICNIDSGTPQRRVLRTFHIHTCTCLAMHVHIHVLNACMALEKHK